MSNLKRTRIDEDAGKEGAGTEDVEMRDVSGEPAPDNDEDVEPLARELALTERPPLALNDLFRTQQKQTDMKEEDSKPFSCVGLAEGLADDELLFSDPANDAVQRLVWNDNPTIVKVYVATSETKVRAISRIRKTLLVVERHQKVVPQQFWLVEAYWNDKSNMFQKLADVTDGGRHQLMHLPKMPEGNLVSLETFTFVTSSASTSSTSAAPAADAVPADRVLTGICGSSTLEQFAVDADGRVRRLPALELEFKQFCFAIDRPSSSTSGGEGAGAGAQRLLFVTPRGEHCVRIFALTAATSSASAGELEAEQLRRLSGCDCSRLLAFGDCVLGGLWSAETDAHAIHAWRVAPPKTQKKTTQPQTERLGIVYAGGADVNCWAVVRLRASKNSGTTVVLFDTNREELLELEWKKKAGKKDSELSHLELHADPQEVGPRELHKLLAEKLSKHRAQHEKKLTCLEVAAGLAPGFVLIVDPPNDAVRSFSFGPPVKMDTVYKCSKEKTLRAVRYVPGPAGSDSSGTLLAAELQVTGLATKCMSYCLAVSSLKPENAPESTPATSSALEATASSPPPAAAKATATAATAFELKSAPTGLDIGRFVQIVVLSALNSGAVDKALERFSARAAATPSSGGGSADEANAGTSTSTGTGTEPPSVVLCGLCKCNSLDVFFVDEPGKCRPMKGLLQLPFSQFCFTCGVCDGVPLMFASVEGEPYVKLLSVRLEGERPDETLRLTQLRKIQAHCSRILWLESAQLLLCAKWKPATDSHAVNTWRVSRGGRRTDRCGKALTKEEGVDINTWCAPPAAAASSASAGVPARDASLAVSDGSTSTSTSATPTAEGAHSTSGAVGQNENPVGNAPATNSSDIVVLFDVNREQLVQYELIVPPPPNPN